MHNKRIYDYDFVKGILITLMVIFHLTLTSQSFLIVKEWVYVFYKIVIVYALVVHSIARLLIVILLCANTLCSVLTKAHTPLPCQCHW